MLSLGRKTTENPLYNSPQETRLFGKKLVFFPECSSTNSEAFRFTESQGIIHGAVVICDNQYAGRGQAGNTWLSAPGENLTFSLILEDPISPDRQFFLTIFLTVALAKTLSHISGTAVQVKWPNDLIVNGKKIGGILIENAVQGSRIRYSVLGIGLNINQTSFGELPATSLALLTAKSFNLQEIFDTLLVSIEHEFERMKSGLHLQLKEEWLKLLYLRGISHSFKTPEGSFQGVVEGIDDHGRLIVADGQEFRVFNFKEIIF